jgi:transposase-like protein
MATLRFNMVYHYISPDMKRRALLLLQKGWSVEDIMEALGVLLKSITCWEDN